MEGELGEPRLPAASRWQLRTPIAAPNSLEAPLAGAGWASSSRQLHSPRRSLTRRRRWMAATHVDKRECSTRLFENNFVAPLVMQYMDVPTLVAFTSTNRSHHRQLHDEVLRRKQRIHQLREEIRIRVEYFRPLSQSELREACSRHDEARRLIDGGLDWLCPKNHVQDRLDVDGATCGTCSRDRLFLAERLILKPHSLRDLAEVCPLLPLLFYAPSEDTSATCEQDDVAELITEASVREMQQLVTHIWTGERLSYSRKHADQVMEEVVRDRSSSSSSTLSKGSKSSSSSNPYACNLDCPLRIVEARSQRHTSGSRYDMEEVHNQLVCRTAKRLVGDAVAVESFRLACRHFVKDHPLSLPFLLWILTEIEAEQKNRGRSTWDDG